MVSNSLVQMIGIVKVEGIWNWKPFDVMMNSSHKLYDAAYINDECVFCTKPTLIKCIRFNEKIRGEEKTMEANWKDTYWKSVNELAD